MELLHTQLGHRRRSVCIKIALAFVVVILVEVVLRIKKGFK
jgi:hypothetical protein